MGQDKAGYTYGLGKGNTRQGGGTGEEREKCTAMGEGISRVKGVKDVHQGEVEIAS